MKRKRAHTIAGVAVMLRTVFVLCGWWLVSAPAYPHHNINAFFNVRERVTIAGVITEVRMVNPHSRITMAVETDQGGTESWILETGSVTTMALNHGWTQDTIPVGSRVLAHGFPAFSGRPMMALIHFTFEDGREVRANLDRYLRVPQDN